MVWNPNAPTVLGFEWLTKTNKDYPISTNGAGLGITHTAASSETIDKASIHLQDMVGSGRFALDVYLKTDVVNADAEASNVFRPNEDVVVTNCAKTGGSTSNLFQAIDEAVLDTSDSIFENQSPFANIALEYAGRMAVGTGNLANQRIVRVQLVMVTGTQNQSAAVVTPYLNIGGTKYNAQPFSPPFDPLSPPLVYTSTWELNPATGNPWTIAEIEAFDTSDEFGWTQTGSWVSGIAFYQAYFNIVTVAEKRIASGYLDISSVGWKEFNLTTPTGGSTWSKVSGTGYTYMLRRVSGSGALTTRGPDSGEDPPHGEYIVGWQHAINNPAGVVSTGAQTWTAIPGLIITTSGPAVSADSQPYVDFLCDPTGSPVWSSETWEQEFTPAANGTYAFVRLTVAADDPLNPPTGDLLVKIRKRSDDSQVGGTGTITFEDELVVPRDAPQVVGVPLASGAALVAATQYYLELSSATDTDHRWRVGILNTDTADSGTNGSGFGGTTDIASNDTSGNLAYVDIPFSLNTQPAAPTGFSVVILSS